MNRRSSDKINRIDASEVVRRAKSEVLIDGYNLMHVTRFKPIRQSEGELKRCREGMLSLLAEMMPAERYRKVTIVFDSQAAPRHLEDAVRWQHLHVLFARDENSADDLISILINKSAHPKRLVVVSSDHRVQIAAQRKKATAIDSDVWFDALLEEPKPTRETQVANEETLSPADLAAFRADMKMPLKETEGDEQLDQDFYENPFPKGYFDGIE